jgi:ADP-dependent phosphofructokinase/glucokinase
MELRPPPKTDAEFRVLLNGIIADERTSTPPGSVLAQSDADYLRKLLLALHAGKHAIVIVEEDDRLKYMFASTNRSEAVRLMGKVLETVGRRLGEQA